MFPSMVDRFEHCHHSYHCFALFPARRKEETVALRYISSIAVHYKLNKTTQISEIRCPKKRPPFYFSINSLKNEPILMIFGVLNPEKI